LILRSTGDPEFDPEGFGFNRACTRRRGYFADQVAGYGDRVADAFTPDNEHRYCYQHSTKYKKVILWKLAVTLIVSLLGDAVLLHGNLKPTMPVLHFEKCSVMLPVVPLPS